MLFHRAMFLLVLFAASLQTGAAFACACCAEPGARMLHDNDISDYEIGEFDKLTSVGPTILYSTVCGDECISGITDIRWEYDAEWSLQAGTLRIVIKDPAGSITLKLPQQYTRFSVDTEPLTSGYSPILYTEFRFEAAINADGIFAPSDQASGQLILAGPSNLCWAAHNFTHWALQVSGPDADFRLFGGLSEQ